MKNNEIITIKARRCKMCGRLLTSEQAIKDGYGERCKCKARKEEQENAPIPGQMSLFDLEKQMKI